jgi:superfamily II DNA or RNA helicase
MTTLSNRGYGVPLLTYHDKIESLTNCLTVQPNTQGYVGNKVSTTFKVYLESTKKIYIPKHYGLTHFGVPSVLKLDKCCDMHPDVTFVGTIRDNQSPAISAFLKKAKDPKHMGGILELPPGWGKTVMALYIATVLNKKTIVVVHKDFLLKQWKERIEQYIPNARIGLIKQSNWKLIDCDIVLASLQTLCMRDFNDTTFGLVIIDECHHMGAQVFSQAFHKMNFLYSLGLSATVTRTDGLTKVFKWFLGDVVFKGKRNLEEQKGLKVIVKEYNDTNPTYCFEFVMYNGKVNMPKMINNICSYQPRTDMICDEISIVLNEDEHRNFLILSDRRQHLVDIYNTLSDRLQINKDRMGYYVGGMKNNDLLISESKQILLGTYNMVSEGFDLPKLDTLIMASPKSSVEQSIGRIQRKTIQERVYTPLVIDIVDTFSIFQNQARKRASFYKKSGFKVQTTFIDSDNIEVEETDEIYNNKNVFKLNGKSMFLKE